MEVLYIILSAVGFIALGLYQKYYIKILRNQIDYQNTILESQNKTIEHLKVHVDIYQPEKIKEFVKMREDTFEDKKNAEIKRIKSEIDKKLQGRSEQVIKILLTEYLSALRIIFDLIRFVKPPLRSLVINKASDSVTKEGITEAMFDTPYYEDILISNLSEEVKKK